MKKSIDTTTLLHISSEIEWNLLFSYSSSKTVPIEKVLGLIFVIFS